MLHLDGEVACGKVEQEVLLIRADGEFEVLQEVGVVGLQQEAAQPTLEGLLTVLSETPVIIRTSWQLIFKKDKTSYTGRESKRTSLRPYYSNVRQNVFARKSRCTKYVREKKT